MNCMVNVWPEKAGTYRFKVGDIVDHVMGDMISTVVCRTRSAAGIEIYALIEHEGTSRELRFIRGPYIELAKRSKATA